jgi:hypothetical protein
VIVRYPSIPVVALLYGFLLVALAAGSTPRTVGDGGEYLAYALALSRGHAPSLSADTLAIVKQDIPAIEPRLAGWEIETSAHQDRSGRWEFVHFWLYPLLATPFVWLLWMVHADPRAGFTLLHVGLMVVAFETLRRHQGVAIALFLLAGPIVWWVDKAHPEVLLFTLTAIALAIRRGRPGTAMAIVGVAAAQVPPFAVLIPLLAGATILERRDAWRERSFRLGLIVATSLALLPSAYYLIRFGTPTLLGTATRPHWPSLTELGAVLWDLNLGLVPNWPLFALAVVTAFVLTASDRRRLAGPDLFAALASGVVLLVAFAQIGNFTHGATPGIVRYAIWLVPLAVPLFGAVADDVRWQRVAWGLALVSVPICLVYFHPVREDFSHRPTWLARLVWRHAPGRSHPLPKVFAVTVRPMGTALPATTPGCEKVLLVGRGEAQGMWPTPCAPVRVPDHCLEAGSLCYANREGRGYRFDPVSHDADLPYDPRTVWSKPAELAVLAAMTDADWWSLPRAQPSVPGVMVRSWTGVRLEALFESDGRMVAVLRDTGPHAQIMLRVPRRVAGVLIDGDTGTVLARPSHDGSTNDLWPVPLAPGTRLQLLALKPTFQ